MLSSPSLSAASAQAAYTMFKKMEGFDLIIIGAGKSHRTTKCELDHEIDRDTWLVHAQDVSQRAP
jgi:hypothetical protein